MAKRITSTYTAAPGWKFPTSPTPLLPKGSTDRRVLVATPSAGLRRQVTRALVSIGCDVESCPLDQELLATPGLTEPRDMYVVDADTPGSRSFLDALQRQNPGAIVLALSREHTNPYVRDLLTAHQVSNLIARHGGVATNREIIDETELITTCHKLFSGDVFGIEKYLTACGVRIHHAQVGGTADKSASLADLENFLQRLHVHEAITHDVVTVTDELLMNAMFAAPCDASGRPKYAQRDRSLPLVLERGERATLQYGCDGRHVVVAISDRFGELSRSSILKYLEPCLSGAQLVVSQQTAGAGIGLSMVFGAITQLVFNVQPGVRTEVIALFYVRGGRLAYRASGRSLNMFTVNGPYD